MKGTVKFFNQSKNFGFVAGEDGQDYFIHGSVVPDGVELTDGAAVEFEGSQGDRGLKVDSVSLGSADADEQPAEEPAEETSEGGDDAAEENTEEPSE